MQAKSVPKAIGFSIEGRFVRGVKVAGFAGLQNGELMAAQDLLYSYRTVDITALCLVIAGRVRRSD
jgi:hypothetical protein